MIGRLAAVAGLAVFAASASVAAAQRPLADSLLMAGRVADAESMYYGEADAHPRDPEARAALGRYLAARGAVRVGAVLLEEARQFGGDPAAIARDLAPLYRALGDYRALLTLPASPLTRVERAQALWLVSHPPSLAMPESVVVAVRTAAEPPLLFSLRVRIDGRDVDAVVDPRCKGVMLDGSWRRRAAALFGERASAPLGAVASVTIGPLSLGNVPVAFAPAGSAKRVVLGLDVLARFAPTADLAAGRMILRSSGEPPANAPGEHLPTLTDADGIRMRIDGHFVKLGSADAARRLRGRRWTLDDHGGELVLDR